jgi:hypothetical protein
MRASRLVSRHSPSRRGSTKSASRRCSLRVFVVKCFRLPLPSQSPFPFINKAQSVKRMPVVASRNPLCLCASVASVPQA